MMQIQHAAFEVFAEQLDKITDKVRQELRPAIVKILDIIKEVLPSASEQLLLSTLRSLSAITSSMSTGEEYALTAVVPIVMATVQRREATSSALTILLTLVYVEETRFDIVFDVPCRQKLGPRIIPFFRDIIKECVGVISEDDAQSQVESVGVLHALLTSIPSFWSSGDLLVVVELYLKQNSSESRQPVGPLSSFIKTMAKRAPPKVLLPTVCDLWTRLSADDVCYNLVSVYTN
jgi:U3 small nucleolar RNA-associated protein 10